MLGCIVDHVTPAIRLHDDFTQLSVSALGTGDEVWLETGDASVHRLESGLSPFPKLEGATHVKFRKKCGSSPVPTTIEIHRGRA